MLWNSSVYYVLGEVGLKLDRYKTLSYTIGKKILDSC